MTHRTPSILPFPPPLSADFASVRCYLGTITDAAMRERALLILARIERRARPLGVRFDDELDYPRRDW
jgi:hypothetical protein